MGFWDKVKDFVGIEDDYYEEDEFHNDYQDEKNIDNIEYNISENEEVKEDSTIRFNKQDNSDAKASKVSNFSRSYENKSYSSNNMDVTIKEPLTYEDGKSVLDDIISGKTVVLNLEKLEMDKKTQIFYFVSGGLYSLKGSLSNVTKDIYVLVPEGVKVDGKLSKSIADKSFY